MSVKSRLKNAFSTAKAVFSKEGAKAIFSKNGVKSAFKNATNRRHLAVNGVTASVATNLCAILGAASGLALLPVAGIAFATYVTLDGAAGAVKAAKTAKAAKNAPSA